MFVWIHHNFVVVLIENNRVSAKETVPQDLQSTGGTDHELALVVQPHELLVTAEKHLLVVQTKRNVGEVVESRLVAVALLEIILGVHRTSRLRTEYVQNVHKNGYVEV